MTIARLFVFALVGAFLASALSIGIAHEPQALAAADATAETQADGGVQQDQPVEDDDSRIDVMVWTVFAATLAVSIGLLLFLLRLIMGWVKAPPAPQEEHH
jgi:hypothetical protein